MTTPRTTWAPLVTGSQAEQVRLAVEAIADDLLAASVEVGDGRGAGLGGSGGAALMYATLDRAWPGRGHRERASAAMDEAIAALERDVVAPSLLFGFGGLAWLMTVFDTHFGVDPDDDPLDEAIDALMRSGARGFSPWDLVHGAVGLGIVALRRRARPWAHEAITALVDRLWDTAHRDDRGMSWVTPPSLIPADTRRSWPQGHVNVGVAHGVTGVVGWLCAVARHGIVHPRIEPMVEQAVAWVLAVTHEVSPPCVPRFVGPDGGRQPAQLAWCYGEPATAVVLLAAARQFGREDWEQHARAQAHTVAAGHESFGALPDAGLCHGTVGVGHMLHRLHLATAEPALASAAVAAYACTLAARRPGHGIGGYQTRTMAPDGARRWIDDPGLLMGAAGIGLGLLAAIDSQAPPWGDVFALEIGS